MTHKQQSQTHPVSQTQRPPMALILTLLLLAMPTAKAEKLELEVGLTTHHWTTKNLYENSQLIGAGYKGWELSTFVNSYEDRSYGAGYRWNLSRSFSLSAGVIHGYGENAERFPIRLDEEVIYFMVNAEPPTNGPLSVRLRMMGEITLLSLIVRPNEKFKRLDAVGVAE